MLSLTDELRKFQKLAYDNDLDTIITVQDNFSNGSVTIRDLVKENHLIIGEFKRMKSVFINYTKINQKIYDKIAEHELTIGSSVLKLGNMTNFFQNTIDGTLDKMKVVYEDTVHQNRLAVDVFDKRVKPVYEEINKKVDIDKFNLAMRALNGSEHGDEETDVAKGKHQTQQHKEKQKAQASSSDVTIPKSQARGKKISEQELNNIKADVLEQISTADKTNEVRIAEIYTKIEQNRKLALTGSEEMYHQVCSKITQFQNNSTLESAKLKESIQAVSDSLEKKTHYKVWDSYKNSILQEIKHKISEVTDKLEEVQKGYQNMAGITNESIKQMQSQLSKQIQTNQKTQTDIVQEIMKKSQRNLTQTNNRFDEINRQLKDQKETSERSITSLQKTVISHRQQNSTDILDLRDNLDKLVISLEGSVLKLVIKRFQQNITELTTEMRQLKRAEIEISKRVSIAFQNINDIKEVTGRKANFTDIVNLFEKKASKEQVTVIKDMLSTSELNARKDDVVPESNRRLGESCQLRLKSSLARTSKRLSPDRTLQSASVTLGFGSDKSKNKARFQSKRFQFRPQTARLPIFN